jgi:[calcium/calmodulin-dependent protein kinase] kinase
MESVKEVVARASDDTLNPNAITSEDYTGYEGDVFESGDDNEEQEDSDDDFIVMTRKKKGKEGLERSNTTSNTELSRHNVRRELASACRRRSTRSGSNGTVKKIRPYENTDDEDHHREPSSETK